MKINQFKNIYVLTIMMIFVSLLSSCGGGGGGGSTVVVQQTGSVEGYVYVPVGSEAARMVLDAAAGYKPLSGASVAVTCGTTNKTATTNSTGYFKVSSVPTGTCSVNISKTGFTTITSSATIKANTTVKVGGGTGEVNMNPSTSGSIKVTVNVSGGEVYIDNIETNTAMPSSKSYTFGNIAPGNHSVKVVQSGYDTVTAHTVSVTAGSTSEVTFTLNPTGNRAPVANAGTDAKTFVGTYYTYQYVNGDISDYTAHQNYYTLDGSGSSDADGNALTYKWEQTIGTTVTLSEASASKTTFIPTQAGTYTFKLTVSDGYVEGNPDYVTVTASKISGKISFSIGGLGYGSSEILTMNADGSNLSRLTRNSYYDGGPEWSPDGTKILYTANPSGDETTYYIATMNADGSGVNVTSVQGGGQDWSPDGEHLLGYSKYSGVLEIYEYSTDGTNPVRLTTTGLTKAFGMYSRDGTKILFNQSYGGDKYQVMVMDSDGGNLTRLTNDNSIHFYINWTNDNKVLYTTTTALGSNHVLYAMNSDGTSSELWPAPSGINDVEQPVMTDDGNFIFYSDDDLKLHVMYSDGSADLNLGIYGISPDYNANE